MNTKQAKAWVRQELAKVCTKEQAQAHLSAYRKTCEGFFKSPAGIASEQRDPIARQARHDLARGVRRKFEL